MVIADFAMPGIDRAETTSRLLASMPHIQGNWLQLRRLDEAKALEAGAVGFVAKGTPIDELVTAIHRGRRAMERTGEPR